MELIAVNESSAYKLYRKIGLFGVALVSILAIADWVFRNI